MRALFAWLSAACVACGPSTVRDSIDAAGGDNIDSGSGGSGSGSDAGTTTGDGGAGVTYVYAHSSSALYRVDPDTLAVTLVGAFGWSHGPDEMTDLAIDKNGLMIGMSYSAVYHINAMTAQTMRLSSGLAGRFNGLSFVPATMLGQTGDDVLVATRGEDGAVFRVNPTSGATSLVGNMGNYSSSGDLVSITGLGTLQTTGNDPSNDRLARLAPSTFSATPIGNSIGFADVWGIAFWKDKVFGFTSSGQFITINPNTGVGTLVQSNGPSWWGAAVTTSAPVVLL
jgi:hypothetical protein